MSTTLLVIRHGQTDWNKDYRFRGRADLALNEVGQHQAELVGQRLAADFHPSAIYSSPLRRSLQTADAIASHIGVKPGVEDGLVDLDFGQFSGLSRAEAESKFPELYRMWLNAPHVTRFPEGESLEDVRVRVTESVERISERYEGQQVVLVSHVDVIRTLLCSLVGLHTGHIQAFRIDPASLSVVEMRGGRAELVMTNSMCHLAGQVPATVGAEGDARLA